MVHSKSPCAISIPIHNAVGIRKNRNWSGSSISTIALVSLVAATEQTTPINIKSISPPINLYRNYTQDIPTASPILHDPLHRLYKILHVTAYTLIHDLLDMSVALPQQITTFHVRVGMVCEYAQYNHYANL